MSALSFVAKGKDFAAPALDFHQTHEISRMMERTAQAVESALLTRPRPAPI
jgi:hypothetical protein